MVKRPHLLPRPLQKIAFRWGAILRVDFTLPGGDLSPFINRILCWETAASRFPIMFAIGQKVPPLEKPN
jgi:hypothetical protein